MAFLIIMFPPFAYGDYTDDCKPENTWTQKSEEGNFGKDREITGTVCVDTGVYHYLNVNIYSKDGKTETKLIFKDAKIDFWARSILVENGGSLIAGSPEEPIGTKDIKNTLTIHLYGSENDKAPGITCRTTSVDDHITCGVPNDRWAHGNSSKGTLPGGVPDDYFYAYKNLPTYDGQNEGDYFFGRKTLAVSYGGKLQMFGKKGATYFDKVDQSKAAIVKAPVKKGDVHLALGRFVDWNPGDKIALVPKDNLTGSYSIYTIQKVTAESGDLHANITIEDSGITFDDDGKTDYMVVLMDPSGTSWARLKGNLAEDKTAKEKTLTLDRAVDWQPKDEIVVTTTDYLPGHSEKFTIKSVDETKTQITFNEQIQYPHNGEAYSLDKHKIPDRLKSEGFRIKEVETRSAVALLSRNIRIVSEGTDYNKPFPDDGYFGGHTIVRQGFKQYQVQGVEFYQLGQGGRMAHSPVNFHLTRQAPTGTYVRDCSVNESMTRWYELRGAQNVSLERNVGWKSIGHGYLLADGTEVNNTLRANLGILALAAVDNPQNSRKVPGVMAMTTFDQHYPKDPRPEYKSDFLTYQSDYYHPAVFHIMNAYNTFEYNMAAGAGTCGACYWLVPTKVSGLSRPQKWEGYANIQTDTPGAAPIKTFKGNFCTTAQYSLMTIGSPGVCEGVTDNPDIKDRLFPVRNTFTNIYVNLDLFPMTSNASNLQPNVCTDAACSNATCNKGRTGQCAVSVIDSYTSSFHWAQTNYAAIWLRTNWFLMTDSALTDVLHGGLTMVSGGSYDQAINGYWALTRNSVFIGNTQSWDTTKSPPVGNPYATNAGPFHSFDKGLKCDAGTPASCCLSKAEGISVPIDNFAVYQRLYSIYDGPVYQENNAYLNIKKIPIDKCGYPGGGCGSDYMYGSNGRGMGIPRAQEDSATVKKGTCILPNAAIGWKQPNGFYYPPAFHSRNLYFNDVDIRHYIIVPLFKPGTAGVHIPWVERDYCFYPGEPDKLFGGSFTDVDRQTELNDDDGTLSGLAGANPKQGKLEGTVAVNRDVFFETPVETMECLSEQTCFQSPYDYVSAVVYPDCAALGTEGRQKYISDPDDGSSPCVFKNQKSERILDPDWSDMCEDRSCYGVPIYRQYLKDGEKPDPAQSLRMMGAGISQRSTMIANGGSYFVDTGSSTDDQGKEVNNIDPVSATFNYSLFKGGQKYNFFFLYAKALTHVKFQMYVGKGFDRDKDLKMVRVGTVRDKDDGPVLISPLEFKPSDWPNDKNWKKDYNADTGILKVTLDMSAYGEEFNIGEESCRPKSFCRWDAGRGKCCAASDSSKCDDAVCNWSVKAAECPTGGCLGFQVQLPKSFGPPPTPSFAPYTVTKVEEKEGERGLKKVTLTLDKPVQCSDSQESACTLVKRLNLNNNQFTAWAWLDKTPAAGTRELSLKGNFPTQYWWIDPDPKVPPPQIILTTPVYTKADRLNLTRNTLTEPFPPDWNSVQWIPASKDNAQDSKVSEISETLQIDGIDSTKTKITLKAPGIQNFKKYSYSQAKRVDSSGNTTGWAWLKKDTPPTNYLLTLDRAVDWQKGDTILITTPSSCNYYIDPKNDPRNVSPTPGDLWQE